MLSIELGEILTAEVPQRLLGEIVHDKAVARGEKFILDGANFPAGIVGVDAVEKAGSIYLSGSSSKKCACLSM